MAIKKSELYSSLWKSCDELRGGMDASQYKDYVLTMLYDNENLTRPIFCILSFLFYIWSILLIIYLCHLHYLFP